MSVEINGSSVTQLVSVQGALGIRPGTIGCGGDSLTASQENNSFTTPASTGAITNERFSNSILFWLDVLLGGGRVQSYANTAVGGSTWSQSSTTQLQNLLSSTVLPQFWFMIGTGTNDLFANSGTKTAADIQPSAIKTYDAIVNAGMIPIICTIPPRDPATSSANFPSQTWTTAKDNERIAFNAWLLSTVVARYPTAIVIDLSSYLAGKSPWMDGLHFSAAGAYDIALNLIKPILAPLFRARKSKIVPGSDRDTLALWSGSNQLVDWPTFSSTSGGATAFSAPNSITGTVAQAWTAVASNGSGGATTVAASVVAASTALTSAMSAALDIPAAAGNAQKMVITTTASGDTAQLTSQPSAARISAGDTFYGVGFLVLKNMVNLTEARLSAKITYAAGSVEAICGSSQGGTRLSMDAIFSGKTMLVPFVTPAFSVPAGVTPTGIDLRYSLYFGGAGGDTAYFMMAGLRKGSPPYP